jgi:hypothetical protein
LITDHNSRAHIPSAGPCDPILELTMVGRCLPAVW